MATSVRRTVVSLPAAPLGPENPLPALTTLDETHRLDDAGRAALPADAARQAGYAPLSSVLPVRLRDSYGRDRAPRELPALVIENDRLTATVLPGLGGRVYSLVHRPTGRELLYRNPVWQPADFALNGAWFSGGVEWNIGATGHTTLCCAPVHAARVAAPDGGEMLRLWEWERLRDLPFQVDLWLPDGSDFLYVGVRVRNPHHQPAPVYWWSNIAVPQDAGTRVLVPADAAWHFGYSGALRRVPVPYQQGADRSYPARGEYPADFFYDVPEEQRRWITALDGRGHGLAQTSTDLLRGRKLFLWGDSRGGRRWQDWLTEAGTGGYAEIQAGLARTQLEHVPLPARDAFSWLEAYGPLSVDPAAAHDQDWHAASRAVAAHLEAALPRATVDAAYAAWLPYADAAPTESLHTGSGWGALEVERAGFDLPGTPFEPTTLGAEQRPWRDLLRTGTLPAADRRPDIPLPPGPSLVSVPWREQLENADADLPDPSHVTYHLGVAQWHAGDRSQAVRSWERAAWAAGPTGGPYWPALRALAEADREAGRADRSAERASLAFHTAWREYSTWRDATTDGADRAGAAAWWAAVAALGREAVGALRRSGRAEEALAVLDTLPTEISDRGRFQLLRAQALLAAGDPESARAVLDGRVEVADLREGDEVLSDTWFAVAERLVAAGGAVTEEVRDRARREHPLPDRYDFRMRPV